jgi:hypothetical protein
MFFLGRSRVVFASKLKGESTVYQKKAKAL